MTNCLVNWLAIKNQRRQQGRNMEPVAVEDNKKKKKNKKEKKKKEKKEKKVKKEKKEKKKKDKKHKKEKKRDRTEAHLDDSFANNKRPKLNQDPAVVEQCTASCGKVFIAGLKQDATDSSVCDYFEKKCGTVDDTYWLTDRKTGVFRGSGFMTFEDIECAVSACGMTGSSDCPVADNGALSVVPARPMASWKGTMHSGKTTKVFVKNMSYDITEKDLNEFFATHAPRAKVHSVQWREDDGGNFDGTALVEFTSAGGASLAIDSCHGVECLGRAMTCKPATARMAQGITVDGKKPAGENKALKIKPLSERPEGGTTVCFVGNLPFKVTDEEMTAFAGGEEVVKQIRWLEFEDTGKFKGCGFVEFHDIESVDHFVTLNGKDFGGRNIQVDYSTKKTSADYDD